jgi:hypothetical protein
MARVWEMWEVRKTHKSGQLASKKPFGEFSMYTRLTSIIVIVFALTLIIGCGGGSNRQSSATEQVSPGTTSLEKPVSRQYRIVMWDANLHADANGNSPVVARVRQGERLEALKQKDLTFKDVTVPWYYVRTQTGQTGWICDADLQE